MISHEECLSFQPMFPPKCFDNFLPRFEWILRTQGLDAVLGDNALHDFQQEISPCVTAVLKSTTFQTNCEDIRVCGELRDVPYRNPFRMIAFETTLAWALTTVNFVLFSLFSRPRAGMATV